MNILKSWICFNPLPSPKQGETPLGACDAILKRVSIRSPHRSKGRLLLSRRIGPIQRFQSAPLTEARGDASAAITADSNSSFQSAPLTEARGDPRRAISGPLHQGFNPLPSPKQGETWAARTLCHYANKVSIRSPHRSKGRLGQFRLSDRFRRVSIRSPHRSKGRPLPSGLTGSI